MRTLTSFAVMTFLVAITSQSIAQGNLLPDGGFEQRLEEPDGYGNPFKVWGGWTWEGDCRRVADTDIKHSGKSSALMYGRGACKIAVSTEVKTSAGFYKLAGYVRAINLQPGTYGRGIVVSFEANGKEMMTDLPGGTYGWRKFELVRKFDEAYPKNLLYIYLFGSGRVWLDDLSL
ncbi:MAG: hypothetical protein ACYC35_08090, partial [Pirellulales bacterium]